MSKLRIGPIEYEIKREDDLRNGEVELTGQIYYAGCDISIRAGIPDQFARVVLPHEVLHGIMQQSGLDEHPEGFIDAVAFGLLELARNNPQFLSFDFRGLIE